MTEPKSVASFISSEQVETKKMGQMRGLVMVSWLPSL
uniref:Uncharacterized protein n=1 Tax=Rhizophora mucronata TaxID=61149 RepID=A0A2P2LTH1_RHIMU